MLTSLIFFTHNTKSLIYYPHLEDFLKICLKWREAVLNTKELYKISLLQKIPR